MARAAVAVTAVGVSLLRGSRVVAAVVAVAGVDWSWVACQAPSAAAYG